MQNQMMNQLRFKKQLEEQRAREAELAARQQANANKQQNRNLLTNGLKAGYKALDQGSQWMQKSLNPTVSNIGNKIQQPISTAKNLINQPINEITNKIQTPVKGVLNGLEYKVGNILPNHTGTLNLGASTGGLEGISNIPSSAISNSVNNAMNGVDAANNTLNQASAITDTANSAANTTGAATSALSTAGQVAGGLGSVFGMGNSIADMANNGATFDNAKDLGVHTASALAAATGVGLIPAAALELGNGIYNLFTGGQKQKVMENMQNNMRENAKQQQEFNNVGIQGMANQQANAKQMLENAIANNQTATLQDVGITPETTQEPEAVTGGAAPITDNTKINYNKGITSGISQQDLDAFRGSINPADYTTALDENAMQGFNNWVKQDNIPLSNDYDMQGYYQKYVMPYEGLAQQGFTPEQIAGVKQGLNSGNADLAKFIQDNNINTPQGAEQVAAARAGNFNDPGYNPTTKHFTDEFKMPNHKYFSNESKYYNDDNAKYAGTWTGEEYNSPVSTVKTGIDDFKNGLNNGLGSETDGLWGNIGKAANVASNIAGNPALQGLIYGAVDKAMGANTGNAILNGLNWAQNKAKSDYYNQAITGSNRRNIIGSGFDAKDYAAKTDSAYKTGRLAIDQSKYDMYAKDILSKIDYRDKDFNRKVYEFAKTYGLKEKVLQETIRSHMAQESLGKEKNQIGWKNASTNEKRANASIQNSKDKKAYYQEKAGSLKDVYDAIQSGDKQLANRYRSRYIELYGEDPFMKIKSKGNNGINISSYSLSEPSDNYGLPIVNEEDIVWAD